MQTTTQPRFTNLAAPSFYSAVILLKKFQELLPGKIYGGAFTRDLAHLRAKRLKIFLETLKDETFEFTVPN